MGKTFNTGYLQNIIQYDGSNNIILPSLIGTGTRIVVAAANGTLSSQTASTTNIAEGTNLYYTDARVATYLSANTYATQSYVTTAVSNLVDSAPGTLDTLNELAAALGDDPNFATTVATSIGTKQAQLNGTGFVKVAGTTVSYDNSTYLTTSSASSIYLPLTGGSLSTTNTSETLRIVNGGTGYALYVQSDSYFQGDVRFQSASNSILKTVSGLLTPAVAGTDYVIPSALSGYLPLSGGTLTGPLNGTSASFNDNLVLTGSSKQVRLENSSFINFTNSGNTVQRGYIQHDGTNLNIASSVGSITLISALNGTSAVFSGKVTSLTNLGFENTNVSQAGFVANYTGANPVKVSVSTYNNAFAIYDETNGRFIFSQNISTQALSFTGAATFSSSVTISGAGNPALDVQGTAIIRGNSSSHPTHYFTTGAVNVARYLQYNASGTIINQISADSASYFNGGNVLIGTSTDLGYKLNVEASASNAAKFVFKVTGDWGGGANQDHGVVISGARYVNDTNTSLLNVINNDATPLFKVTDHGKVGIGLSNPTTKLWVQQGVSTFACDTVGDAAINTFTSSALLLGPRATRNGLVNSYTAGISFDHLLNYSGPGNTSYSTVPHAWIGIRLIDIPGWERSALVFATRDDVTGTAGTTLERMCVLPNGNVGIGTTTPGQKLDVNGFVRSQRFYSSTNYFGFFPNYGNTTTWEIGSDAAYPGMYFYNNSGGYVFRMTVAGSATFVGGVTSDIRTKENIQTINNNAIDFINELKPVSYEFIGDVNGKTRRGFIAQEVLETSIPSLVLGDGEKEGGTYGLDYDGILALAVKAIQEQQAQIEILKAEIQLLKQQ